VKDPAPTGQVLLYRSEDGRTKLDVRLEDETVWLSQRQLTELFGKAKGTISEHIKHIFEDGELAEGAVVRLFRTTASDGKQYEVTHYNLDMILALGFRVRSAAAVRFRQWAADKLKEYIVKGFVIDDEVGTGVVAVHLFLARQLLDPRLEEGDQLLDLYLPDHVGQLTHVVDEQQACR
jgi:hypothetical protein